MPNSISSAICYCTVFCLPSSPSPSILILGVLSLLCLLCCCYCALPPKHSASPNYAAPSPLDLLAAFSLHPSLQQVSKQAVKGRRRSRLDARSAKQTLHQNFHFSTKEWKSFGKHFVCKQILKSCEFECIFLSNCNFLLYKRKIYFIDK